MTNAEYQELYDRIVGVKDKYRDELLAIEGVHAVGVNVFDQAIVVSVDDPSIDVLSQIPTELNGFLVECRGSHPPTPLAPSPEDAPIPYDNLTDQVVYAGKEGWYKANYTMPLSAGNSVGKMYWAGAGTLGAIFWSNKLQNHVAHTCRHVLGGIGETFYRQDTNNSLDFEVLGGGTPYGGPDFSDAKTTVWRRRPNQYLACYSNNYPDIDPKYQLDYGKPNGQAHMNSISPTSGAAGDVITINTIGCGNRRGHTQVLFNGVSAKVKSWVSEYDYLVYSEYLSTIEVYVPDIPAGMVQVKLNVEGETVLGPAMLDGSDILINYIGQVEEIIPWMVDAQSDSSLVVLDDELPIRGEIPTKPAPNYSLSTKMSCNCDTALGGMYPGREYRMQGIYRGPYFTGMIVMKTGRTTGTTFGMVRDPSYDWKVNYSDDDWRVQPLCTVQDTIDCWAPRFVNAEQTTDPTGEIDTTHPNWSQDQIEVPGYGSFNMITEFAYSGDSGAGIYTATYEDYVNYCNKYGLVIQPRDPDTPPDPPPGLLCATLSFGAGFYGSGGGDKAYKYVDYHDLDIPRLPMEIVGQMALSSGSPVTVTIIVTWEAKPQIKSTSTMNFSALLGTIIYTAPINMRTHTAPRDHDSIDFAMEWYLRELSTNSEINLMASTTMSVEKTPPVPVGIRSQGTLFEITVQVEMSVEIVPVVQIQDIKGPINIPIKTELSVNAYLDLRADIVSNSSTNSVIRVWGVIELLPNRLVSKPPPLDNTNIDFALEGYCSVLDAEAPLNVEVSAGMMVEFVAVVQLATTAPLTIAALSAGLQINPAIISTLGLGAAIALAPKVRTNIELVVKLLPLFLSRSERELEVQATINDYPYDKTQVISFDIEDALIPSEDFTLGAVISSKLTLSLRTSDVIPSNAKIIPGVRLKGPEGVTEWVHLGVYYIDTRGYQNNVWTFTCYDKLILSQQTYASSLTYPATMADVFNEICGQLGMSPDTSVAINSTYMIPYQDLDITMHDMLGYIASAHGSSVRITKDLEKIAFVRFSAAAGRTSIKASDYFTAQQTNPLKTYTAICLTYNTDGETLTVGTGDADHTLNIYNPFMTQEMLNTVFAGLNGFSYMPFAMDWKGNPTLDIGTSVTVTQRDGSTFDSLFLTSKSSYKGGLKATVTAPSYSPQRSETDYKGGLKQYVNSQLSKSLQTDQPYYGVTIGRANGLKIAKLDGVSTAYFNSDKLEIDRNGSSVFKVNQDGYVELTGVKINGGTITWGSGGVNPPTAGDVKALPLGWTPDLSNYVTSSYLSSTLNGYATTSSLTQYLTNSQLTTILGTDYVVTGRVAANRIAVGTLDGFTITGATIEAKNTMKVASNVWNGTSSSYGIQFGSTITNYAVPATMKYYQGLAGDGNTFLEIKGSGDCSIEIRGGWFEVYTPSTFYYDLNVNGSIYTNTLAARSGTRINIGPYGCNFNNTSDGIMRLANSSGSYLMISAGNSLVFYKASGGSVTLA